MFIAEDDLWLASTEGGIARRLTAGAGECALPRISPDGTLVAYVGRDEGHPEIYTIPIAGGLPTRRTHLGSEALYLSGWSTGGSELHFASDAGSPFVKETNAFAVALDGSA